MTDGTRNLTVYEVRCERCNVTFPPGTKRCIHCGERIGRPRLIPIGGDEEMPDFAGGEPFPEAEGADAEPGAGRGLRIGFTLLWVLLAVLSTVARNCQGS